MFLQLYHSPFFGDESNKPILLPNEVACLLSPAEAPWSLGGGHSGMPWLWAVVAVAQACRGLQPQLLVAACVVYRGKESPPPTGIWWGLVGQGWWQRTASTLGSERSVATVLRAIGAAP